MAFIAAGNGFGYFLTLTAQDRNLDTVTKTYELRADNEADALVAALDIRAKYEAVSQTVVTGFHCGKRYWNDSIGIPAAGEIQIKARVSYQLKDSPEKETLDIEAPNENIFVATTGKMNKVLDVGDPDVIAYTDLFREAGSCFISDGESLEYLLEGRKVSSKSGLRSR